MSALSPYTKREENLEAVSSQQFISAKTEIAENF